MNKNINLVELLKDCPKGIMFYSRAIGAVTFNCIKSDRICVKNYKGIETAYTKRGKFYYAEEDAEIDLFPSKDQRDWSKWHRPFVDGDVVMCGEDQFAIFKEHIKPLENGGELIRYYVYYDAEEYDLDTIDGQCCMERLATEDEKEELFQAIEDNGYKWNAEEKKLEKLEDMEDKGNISDGYHTFNELYEYRLLYNASMFNELAKQGLYDVHKSKKHSDGTIPFGDENWFIVQAELPTGQISNHYEMKDWDLFKIPEKEKANPYDGHTPKDVAKRLRDFLTLDKSIKPKFKVGDNIRAKNGLQSYRITGVTSEYYSVKVGEHACVGILPVKDQDDWILIPNKFNPKTLEHFNKVLIRQYDVSAWCTDFYSYYDEVGGYAVCTGDVHYDYCIPYNEDTKHLVGKTEDAPAIYRYWEDK
jgi:hypothetical protein